MTSISAAPSRRVAAEGLVGHSAGLLGTDGEDPVELCGVGEERVVAASKRFTESWSSSDEDERAELAVRGQEQQAQWRRELEALSPVARARLFPQS